MKVIEKEDFKYLGLREFKVLKEIEGHPHIIQAHHYFSGGSLNMNSSPNSSPTKMNYSNEKSCDYMTMEYCPNGDLFDMVKRTGKFSSGLTKYFFT